MTLEHDFVKKVEAFIDDPAIFTEKLSKRLLFLLEQYKSKLPERVILVEKPIPNLGRIPTKYIKRMSMTKPQITQEILDVKGINYCKNAGIDFDEFKRSPTGKSSWMVSEVRKEFCKDIMVNYQCSQQILTRYFGVDHSTIVYYLRGRRTKLLKSALNSNQKK